MLPLDSSKGREAERDAFQRAEREEAQVPLGEEKIFLHYAQHRTAHHKVRE